MLSPLWALKYLLGILDQSCEILAYDGLEILMNFKTKDGLLTPMTRVTWWKTYTTSRKSPVQKTKTAEAAAGAHTWSHLPDGLVNLLGSV